MLPEISGTHLIAFIACLAGLLFTVRQLTGLMDWYQGRKNGPQERVIIQDTEGKVRAEFKEITRHMDEKFEQLDNKRALSVANLHSKIDQSNKLIAEIAVENVNLRRSVIDHGNRINKLEEDVAYMRGSNHQK